MTKAKLMIFIFCLGLPMLTQAEVPDFASIKDVKQKKAAFFDYLYPLILAENKKIMAERDVIEKAEDKAELLRICKKYSKECDVVTPEKISKLLIRVDVIPPSLAMAQGANESAWGTSRFAKKANNFFGQWCFKKGCGIVPARRNKGDKQEVRKFKSVQQSVGSYFFNLNSGRVYGQVRQQRASSRNQSKQPTGFEMAQGLVKYSQRGKAYVKEIRSMISYNKLVKKYDLKFWKDLAKI